MWKLIVTVKFYWDSEVLVESASLIAAQLWGVECGWFLNPELEGTLGEINTKIIVIGIGAVNEPPTPCFLELPVGKISSVLSIALTLTGRAWMLEPRQNTSGTDCSDGCTMCVRVNDFSHCWKREHVSVTWGWPALGREKPTSACRCERETERRGGRLTSHLLSWCQGFRVKRWERNLGGCWLPASEFGYQTCWKWTSGEPSLGSVH